MLTRKIFKRSDKKKAGKIRISPTRAMAPAAPPKPIQKGSVTLRL